MTASSPSEEGSGAQSWAWLEQLCFGLWLLLAVAAPWWTKAAVLVFRLLVVVWLIGMATRRLKLRHNKIFLPIAAFLVWTAVASALSYERGASWGRMRGLAMALIAIMLPQTIHSMRKVKWIVAGLAVSTTAVALFTFWQYSYGIGVKLTQTTPGLAAIGLRRNDVIREIGGHRVQSAEQVTTLLTPSSESPARVEIWHGAPFQRRSVQTTTAQLEAAGLSASLLRSRAHPERAQGFFAQYISFAEFLMIVAAFAFGLAIAPDTGGRLLLFVCFAALCGALLLTLTRATWISLLVGCAVALWIYAQKRTRVGIIAVAAVTLCASFIALQHRRHLSSVENDPGTEYRELMWKDGLRLIRQHPIFGVGMDSIFSHADAWDIEAYKRFPNLRSHFHSTYIQVAVENGLPALLLWIWILVTFARQSFRITSSRECFGRASGLGGVAVIVAFALSSFVHYTLGDSEVMVVFWLLCGVISCAQTMQRAAG